MNFRSNNSWISSYKQDGASTNSAVTVQNSTNWLERWIIKWPPNSNDLIPIDVFSWGTLKDRENTIENTEHLK